jgi:hypothetical protein
MSLETLLKSANDKKPADFTKEFKSMVTDKVTDRLTTKPDVKKVVDDEESGGEE